MFGLNVVTHCFVAWSECSSVIMVLFPSNYGPTIAVQSEAAKQGCQQVLWLYGENEEITEVGTMNLFIYWTTEKGGENSFWKLKPSAVLTGCFSI